MIRSKVPLAEASTRSGRPADQSPCATFANQLSAFAEAIRTGAKPAVSARYGGQIVRVLEACEESARREREVRLE
jgi:predicted dehydrogenase